MESLNDFRDSAKPPKIRLLTFPTWIPAHYVSKPELKVMCGITLKVLNLSFPQKPEIKGTRIIMGQICTKAL